MKNKKEITTDLIKMEKFIDYNKKVTVDDKTFEQLMFVYNVAIREIENKIEILKDEFKTFYDYDLVDHINTRIKEPKSIIKKMNDRGLKITYRNMIENINDIAGVRVICPLKKDIFSVRNLIQKLPGLKVLKEKDYVTHPKPSGYSSYHMITGVPVALSQNIIYVKVEIQIRTMAMDFWASLEHKMKYKPENEVNKKETKEWVNCAKILNKIDNKMLLLNE